LLQRADVSPPCVLVGHSLDGLNVRVYNGMYPHDVAAAVLVDAAHEDEPRRAPKFMLGKTPPRFLWHPIWTAAHAARFWMILKPAGHSPGRTQLKI
jgi:pimeloyl-ACP methyl ester carboxylesterase